MAARNQFIQFQIFGRVLGLEWSNSFCWGLNTEDEAILEGEISFNAAQLKATMDPIWNDNGLIFGLQSRYASTLPLQDDCTVDGFRVIARSSTMLNPVQYEGGTSMIGKKAIATSNVDASYTAMYMYAGCDEYGQTGARFWYPLVDEVAKSGNIWLPAILDEVNSPATGVLNSINSQDHAVFFSRNGVAESLNGHTNIVVKRNKIEVAPPMPPYKGIYKYDFPYTGSIFALTCQDFEPDPEVTTQRARKA